MPANPNDLVARMIARARGQLTILPGGPPYQHADVLVKKCGCTHKQVLAFIKGESWVLTPEGNILLHQLGA